MSSKDKITFTKDNLDAYLKELAKEYRKLGGKSMPAEVVLIGGASVLINYGFREMTTDIDAVIQAASTMKEAINHVGDRNDLTRGWINEDFKNTKSFSPKLLMYSTYYKSFYGVLQVRTIAAEYLIAMKLMSGRQYKNDLSDIIGILAEHKKLKKEISMEQIRIAVENLYEAWENIPQISQEFIKDVMQSGDFEAMQLEVSAEEVKARDSLIEFQDNNLGVVNKDNVQNILEQLKKRKN